VPAAWSSGGPSKTRVAPALKTYLCLDLRIGSLQVVDRQVGTVAFNGGPNIAPNALMDSPESIFGRR
jgi:hypothetical protein